MANNVNYKSYFDSIIDDAYNPLQYEIYELGKSDYINNLIAMSSTQFTQLVVIESAYERNGEVRLFKLLYSDSLQNSILKNKNKNVFLFMY